VAVLVAVIGTPRRSAAGLTAFEHGWMVVAGSALLAALAGAVLLAPGRLRAPALAGGSAQAGDHEPERSAAAI
jgi:hypothetical protein